MYYNDDIFQNGGRKNVTNRNFLFRWRTGAQLGSQVHPMMYRIQPIPLENMDHCWTEVQLSGVAEPVY